MIQNKKKITHPVIPIAVILFACLEANFARMNVLLFLDGNSIQEADWGHGS